MLNWLISFIKRLFGSQSDRQFKRTMPQVDEINKLAAHYQSLSDADLQAKTAVFRQDLKIRNADNQQRLDEITESLRGDLDVADPKGLLLPVRVEAAGLLHVSRQPGEATAVAKIHLPD